MSRPSGRFVALVLVVASASPLRASEPTAVSSPHAPIQQRESDLLVGERRAICYSGFRKGQHPDRGDGAVNPTDAEILEHARSTLRDVDAAGSRIVLEHASYTEVGDVLERHGIDGCDRVFLDLGVSSLQIDTAERGFSFLQDGPLDMRMDRERSGKTAAEWIRTVGRADLESALRDYGDERHARRIAAAIVEARRRHPIERTGQLADLVVHALPAPARHGRFAPPPRPPPPAHRRNCPRTAPPVRPPLPPGPRIHRGS